MSTLAKMADFPSSQSLYVIPLLSHGRKVEVQIELRSKERGNKARLYADFNTVAEHTLQLSILYERFNTDYNLQKNNN